MLEAMAEYSLHVSSLLEQLLETFYTIVPRRSYDVYLGLRFSQGLCIMFTVGWLLKAWTLLYDYWQTWAVHCTISSLGVCVLIRLMSGVGYYPPPTYGSAFESIILSMMIFFTGLVIRRKFNERLEPSDRRTMWVRPRFWKRERRDKERTRR